MIRFVLALALCLVTLPFASQQGWAQQGWPDKPIRVIVPLPAGSAVDVVGRLIMTKLGERLGQVMVLENRA
jgi:tripartite-type tricarboxylate transporter receptor subunit TctC